MANKLERYIEVSLLKNKLMADAKGIKKQIDDITYPIMMSYAELKAVDYYKRRYSSTDSAEAIVKLNLWISKEFDAKLKRNILEIRLKTLTNKYNHISRVISQLTDILNYWDKN